MITTLKIIPILLLLTCLSVLASSQSLSMNVMASSGSDFTGDDFSLSWTLGESFIETFEVTEGFQTLGFHQADVTSRQLEVETENKLMWFYPNPVLNILTLQSKEFVGDAVLKVITGTGEVVIERSIQMETSYILNLTSLSAGTYHLQILNDKFQGLTFIKL